MACRTSKAQDIRVFNTEHMSPLFERVIVASGTSNRQTKALASSVRDKVRESGFAKPRVEGEDNGEWIIVDCGPAVAAHHAAGDPPVLPNLEEIWGDKPVHLRGPGTAPARKGADSKKKAAAAGTGQAQPYQESSGQEARHHRPACGGRPPRRMRPPGRRQLIGTGQKGCRRRSTFSQAGGARPTGPQTPGAAKPLAQRVVGKPKPATARPARRRARQGPGRARAERARHGRPCPGRLRADMKLLIVAVGQRVPAWAQNAWDDYAKRFPSELKIELKAIKTEPRSGGKTTEQLMAAERQRIEAALPRGCHVVALDERGTALGTQALAAQLRQWQALGTDVALLIGGPDGLDPALRQAAQQRIRLSDLTLPHAMVRVLLVEQLYRAWSVNAGHPYHRE